MAKNNMDKLTATGEKVLWGGTNDVSNNNSHDALKHLITFVQFESHTNIIIMCVPHVVDWSWVNTEVKTFNRKLEKLMKTFKHVLTIKTDLNREHFTRHGPHMNFWAKN
jgi:peroxiredoxin